MKRNQSPILSLVGDGEYGDWCDREGNAWVCAWQLSQHYGIPESRGTRIRLIARKTPDPGFTHKLKVSVDMFRCLIEPVACNLWYQFWMWLREQEQEGRTHIGVMVLKGREVQ